MTFWEFGWNLKKTQTWNLPIVWFKNISCVHLFPTSIPILFTTQLGRSVDWFWNWSLICCQWCPRLGDLSRPPCPPYSCPRPAQSPRTWRSDPRWWRTSQPHPNGRALEVVHVVVAVVTDLNLLKTQLVQDPIPSLLPPWRWRQRRSWLPCRRWWAHSGWTSLQLRNTCPQSWKLTHLFILSIWTF